MGCVLALLIVFVLVSIFVVRQMMVVGDSMNPTLQSGDRVVVSCLHFTPQYGDIVVIRKPQFRTDAFVKRIIATEGQTVTFDFLRGIVYVDGLALDEPFTLEPTYVQEHITGPVTVPEGCVFVLGDNRNDSMDSRWSAIGCVDTRYIVGKVVLRVFPFDQIGALNYG